MSLSYSPLPSESIRTRPWILSVPAGADWRAVVLADRVRGVLTHFRDRRTVACPRAAGGDCPACEEGYARRWVGYLGVWLYPRRAPALVRLPEGAARAVEGLAAADGGGQLRGLRLRLVRPASDRRAALEVISCGRDPQPDRLPAGLDWDKVLARVLSE